MSNGSTCTPLEGAAFINTHGDSLSCLTRGDSIGLTLDAASGFISLSVVLAGLILIFVSMDDFMPVQTSYLMVT